MVAREALAQTEMHLACVANDATLYSVLRFVAAYDAVSLLVHMLGIMILSQRITIAWRCSSLHRPAFG